MIKTETKTKANPVPDQRIKTLSEVENDRSIRPCLKEIIVDKSINHCEHQTRLAIATELILAKYSDAAITEFFQRMSDYDKAATDYQINHILGYIKNGGRNWKCRTLQGAGVVQPEKCDECDWKRR